MAQVAVPLLHDTAVQKTINDKVLDANRKRFDAYELEQKALKMMDEEVIFASQFNNRPSLTNLYEVDIQS